MIKLSRILESQSSGLADLQLLRDWATDGLEGADVARERVLDEAVNILNVTCCFPVSSTCCCVKSYLLTLFTCISVVQTLVVVVVDSVYFTDLRQLPPTTARLERGGGEAGARPGCPGGQAPRRQRPPADLGPHYGGGQRVRGPRMIQWFFYFIM